MHDNIFQSWPKSSVFYASIIMLFAWVKVVVESLLLHSGAQKFWNVTKSAKAVFLSNKKLAYIMRKHYKNCINFIPAKNCPWDLVSIKYRTHLCNILPKLRHLTKIGYSSRFVYNFSQGRADVVRARF